MHSRSFNGNGYRFGFNGAEKENDIYGEGNAYDLGLRMYDARLAHMFSIDPRISELPNESPYIYAINNPVLFIDKKGGFPLSVHEELVRSALKTKVGTLSADDIVFGTTYIADIGMMPQSSVHFDNMDYTQIMSNWTQINNTLQEVKDDFGSFNKEYGGYDAIKLGVALHSVADFYAHSNYIEVYFDYYKANNDGNLPNIEDIPTFEEAMKDKGFANVAKEQLNTTAFDLTDLPDFGQEKANQEGKRHHNDPDGAVDKRDPERNVVGKNKTVNVYDAAKAVAQKHVAAKVEEVIEE